MRGVLAIALACVASAGTFRLDSLTGLQPLNAKPEVVAYRGRRAVHLVPVREGGDGAMLAVLTEQDFKDGTIEADVAGAPRAGVTPDARGFIGIAFRMQPGDSRYECIYIRPTNGRADDQVRRNHAVQYVSEPEFPWPRLRKESPEKYESYADLVPGEWTHLRIVVAGTKARLYVNQAAQPCLVVNDMKLGEAHGSVALWAHETTDGYFSNLTIR